MTDHTDLGDRMKAYEAHETNRRFLPLLPIYARVDGKCFSKFTRGMDKPYDFNMSMLMIEVATFLVKETHAKIAYVQSDEISLCWYSDSVTSGIFFEGKIFKMTSVLASLATTAFVKGALKHWPDRIEKFSPTFDARVIQLPTKEECANMFLWRERDATKNAISSAARTCYSHKALLKKNSSQLQELLFQKGINFNDYPNFFKRGTFIKKKLVEKHLTDEELNKIPEKKRPKGPILRSNYERLKMPPFGSVLNRVGVIFDDEEPLILDRCEDDEI